MLVARAAAAGVPAIAIVLALPPDAVHDRNASRIGRVVPRAIVTRHLDHLAAALGDGGIGSEGFAALYVLRSAVAIDAAVLVRKAAP